MSSVRKEIKQRRPFASSAEEAVVTLLRRADQLRGALSAVVEPSGITLQQYNVLRILRGAGEEGLPTLEIASRMIEHSPGITRLLDRLETKGLVVRRRCRHDGRRVLCHVSDQALRLLAAVDRPLSRASARVLGVLEPRRQADLIRLLDAIGPTMSSSRRVTETSSRQAKEK
jgi:MarR family transcriptional regulator, organic hydroperoxide resistance regulator